MEQFQKSIVDLENNDEMSPEQEAPLDSKAVEIAHELLKAKKLETMFMRQQMFQNNNLAVVTRQDYREKMILAIIDEAMEMLRETPWKSWKKQQSFHKENYQKECVDLFHFAINLALSAGFTAESLYEAFMEKNTQNIKRQQNGY